MLEKVLESVFEGVKVIIQASKSEDLGSINIELNKKSSVTI